jgi:formylglycine-generating enzyme
MSAFASQAIGDGAEQGLHGMSLVPGGTFRMGSDNHPEEAPVHRVTIDRF